MFLSCGSSSKSIRHRFHWAYENRFKGTGPDDEVYLPLAYLDSSMIG